MAQSGAVFGTDEAAGIDELALEAAGIGEVGSIVEGIRFTTLATLSPKVFPVSLLSREEIRAEVKSTPLPGPCSSFEP